MTGPALNQCESRRQSRRPGRGEKLVSRAVIREERLFLALRSSAEVLAIAAALFRAGEGHRSLLPAPALLSGFNRVDHLCVSGPLAAPPPGFQPSPGVDEGVDSCVSFRFLISSFREMSASAIGRRGIEVETLVPLGPSSLRMGKMIVM